MQMLWREKKGKNGFIFNNFVSIFVSDIGNHTMIRKANQGRAISLNSNVSTNLAPPYDCQQAKDLDKPKKNFHDASSNPSKLHGSPLKSVFIKYEAKSILNSQALVANQVNHKETTIMLGPNTTLAQLILQLVIHHPHNDTSLNIEKINHVCF